MTGSKIMEEIMEEIVPHLLPTIDHGAMGNVHHYNRVWEKIEAWHNRHSSSPAPDALREAVLALLKFSGPVSDEWMDVYLAAVKDVRAALRSGDGWTRVEDGMPKKAGCYLVYRGGHMTNWYMSPEDDFTDEPTWWRHLPPAPEERT